MFTFRVANLIERVSSDSTSSFTKPNLSAGDLIYFISLVLISSISVVWMWLDPIAVWRLLRP